MGLETGTYISDLVSTNPLSGDVRSQGDDHLRLIKACLQATFTGANWKVITGATKSLALPKGTTAQRDSTPVAGMLRYNTSGMFEGYTTSWKTLVTLTAAQGIEAAEVVAPSGSSVIIKQSTASNADNNYVALTGSSDIDTNRGAYAIAFGNEHATSPGVLRLRAGSGGEILLNRSSLSNLGSVSMSGNFYTDGLMRADDGFRSDYLYAASNVSWIKTDSAGGFNLWGVGLGSSAKSHIFFSGQSGSFARVGKVDTGTNGIGVFNDIVGGGDVILSNENGDFRLRASTATVASLPTYNNTTANAANMYVNSSGIFYRSTSSAKYKTSVETLEDSYADAFVLQARPIWYRSLCADDNPHHSYYGYLAEELASIIPQVVQYGYPLKTEEKEGRKELVEDMEAGLQPNGVMYERCVPFLQNKVRRQHLEIQDLRQQLEELQTTVLELSSRLKKLEV